jgi:2-polyprenyl-3-methyl-5-hydroxy-6-metoxy-1,4-benzoquinol methylase
MELSPKEHWENVYQTKNEQEVSWFQLYPETAVQFLHLFQLPYNANIIDVGGGDSRLAEILLDKGYQNIWVLDISENAIEKAKTRMGEKALAIHWIVSDITSFQPPVLFDFWYDRAAFHFLTEPEKIDHYISVAASAVRHNGFLTVGTFSEQGPAKCSGLPVTQYSDVTLTKRFEPAFEKIKCLYRDHVTPFNTIQNFVFCGMRRV